MCFKHICGKANEINTNFRPRAKLFKGMACTFYNHVFIFVNLFSNIVSITSNVNGIGLMFSQLNCPQTEVSVIIQPAIGTKLVVLIRIQSAHHSRLLSVPKSPGHTYVPAGFNFHSNSFILLWVVTKINSLPVMQTFEIQQ